MIKDSLKEQMVIAMKAKDILRLSTIRLIIAKIKDKEINDRTTTSDELNDNGILLLMQGMIKQRNDSIVEYKKGNRLDLADKEEQEIAVIRSFMPKQLEGEELDVVINDAVLHIKAQGVKDISKVINHIKENHAGSVDMSIVAVKVKNKIS